MKQPQRICLWQQSMMGVLAVAGVVISWGDYALAQVTLDGSLGATTPLTAPDYRIPQAVGRTAGANLFHSFRQFNIGSGQSVVFESDATIRNILARVTGGQSSIEGLLRTDSRTANLFLMNPNGIIFGRGARLEVGGSFVATTANEIWFGNQGQFSALPAPGEDLSLLTIDPSALRFNQVAGQAIAPIVTSTDSGRINLSVPNGQSLLLIAGNLSFNRATLESQGGRIELGALAQAATVGLQPGGVGSPIRQQFPDDVARANVSLRNSTVNVQGSDRGDIAIYANQVELLNASTLQAGIRNNQGTPTSRAGNIVIDATGEVLLSVPRDNPNGPGRGQVNQILNQLGRTALGRSGDIIVTAERLTLFGMSSQIRTITSSENARCVAVSCDAGDIIIDVEHLNFDNPSSTTGGGSGLLAGSQGLGNGGDIEVTVRGSAFLGNRGRIQSDVESNEDDTSGIGWRAGSIAITTGRLEVSLGRISSNVSDRGAANNISVVADTINLNRSGRISNNISSPDDPTRITSPGGNVSIQGRSLSLTEGGFIEANTNAAGDGGNIILRFSEDVTLAGLDVRTQFRTRISAAALERATGRGGRIEINARNLSIADGAAITARTEGVSAGGNITVEAQQVALTSGGQILTTTLGSGDAGNITLNVSGRVSMSGRDPLFAEKIREALDRLERGIISSVDLVAVTDGDTSGLFARTTRGSGDAGNIEVRADSVQLENGAQIAASAVALASTVSTTGAGGNINLVADRVQLRTGGEITVGSEGTGRAGNLAIAAPVILLDSGGQITATTTSSSGGNIALNNVTTLQLNNSRISASTETGEAGSLTINARDRVYLRGNGGLLVEATNGGDAGDLSIRTNQLIVENGAQVAVDSSGSGAAGTLRVTANDVLLNNRAALLAETQNGTGGSIRLRIANSLRLNRNSRISASTVNGVGGDLTLNTPSVRANTLIEPTNLVQIRNGSRLSAIARGTGNAGGIALNARRLVIDNRAGDRSDTGILASSISGVGGDITLRGLDELALTNSRVSASTQTGRAGSLTIDAANTVQLRGNGGLSVAASGSNGVAGNLRVRTGRLRVANGARVTVSSPQGQAGNLTIAAEQIRLDQGTMAAETGAAGANQANIQLRGLDLLVLRNSSQISARALNDSNGGNVEIEAAGGYVVAVPNENSNIIANAEGNGNGGNINITTQSILGLIQTDSASIEPLSNPISEINVSSRFGLDGNIVITTPGIEPGQGLLELPEDVTDASRLIAQGCAAGSPIADAESEFVVTGRGGVPLRPEQPLQREAVIADWVSLSDGERRSPPLNSHSSPESPPTEITEAQGWAIAPDGQVVLITQAATVTPASSGLPEGQCPAL
ncbi:filamentous hemagglutinin N-terminal domain-containing protein [Oscillatoria sp. FACHB-1407]|uniref:two-partner secretion domain-containing protein n=1 Tax=Oscillatoria sp. FACHB-1407 TaxID=2692847 RepID=UPI001682DB1C|nr:filamentous hemagglutinin N-terminal domain-containing protein [Oscillatoria sp. FACHB-1407]MBD2462725.1 filamentous hemagglutinin N-terminal domain-containing protein [Oscillatoria sp. FACHB-1407]